MTYPQRALPRWYGRATGSTTPMWCTDPTCRHYGESLDVPWTTADLSGPSEPVTDSCPRCGADLSAYQPEPEGNDE